MVSPSVVNATVPSRSVRAIADPCQRPRTAARGWRKRLPSPQVITAQSASTAAMNAAVEELDEPW